jgi:hypothetical protein
MIQYAVILMILPILITVNSFGSNDLLLQNMSEDINYLFSNLTPDNLGVKENSNQSDRISNAQKNSHESEIKSDNNNMTL